MPVPAKFTSEQMRNSEPIDGAPARFTPEQIKSSLPIDHPEATKPLPPPGMMQRLKEMGMNALPSIGGTLGAIGAGFMAAPSGPGAIAAGMGGAALGGAAGEDLRERLTGEHYSDAKVLKQGAIQGAFEGFGAAAGPVLKGVGARMVEGADDALLKYLNLNVKDLRGAKTIDSAKKVASAVRDEVGNVARGGEEALQKHIQAAMGARTSHTEQMIHEASQNGSVASVRSALAEAKSTALNASENSAARNNIRRIAATVESRFPDLDKASPSELLQLRRELQTEKTAGGVPAWPPNTKDYRMGLARQLNSLIEGSLPAGEGAAFRENNKSVASLMAANNALTRKRLKSAINSGRHDGSSVGATIGAAATAAHTHNPVLAAAGATAGALSGRVPQSLPFIAATRAAGEAAKHPTAQALARYGVPAALRVTDTELESMMNGDDGNEPNR